jgi:hypothetical protein
MDSASHGKQNQACHAGEMRLEYGWRAGKDTYTACIVWFRWVAPGLDFGKKRFWAVDRLGQAINKEVP